MKKQLTIERFSGNDGQTVIFLAIINKESIGRAEILIDDESAFLKDISVTKTEPGWSWFPPFHNQGLNYRGQGVGTALLAAVFNDCEYLGVQELSGVMRGDLEFLAYWYEKNGFEVLEDQKIRRYFSS